MGKLICDQAEHCPERAMCGGAKPHGYESMECGKCPKNPSAKCVEIKEGGCNLQEFARLVEARDFRLRLIGNTLVAMRKLLEER